MLDMALSMNALERTRTIMIGDRLDTDIAFGVAGNLHGEKRFNKNVCDIIDDAFEIGS